MKVQYFRPNMSLRKKWLTICFLSLIALLIVRCEEKVTEEFDKENENENPVHESPLSGYTLSWEDDFDGETLDLDR